MPAKSTGSGKKTTAKKTTAKKATAKKATAKKKTTKSATKKAAPKSTAKKAAPAKAPAKAAPAKRPAAPKSSGTRVRVRQVRSGIGRRRDFRRTLEALGIKHHQGEVVVTRNPAIDGMLYKVRHLISVTPEE
jgi:ribosomal protein L30